VALHIRRGQRRRWGGMAERSGWRRGLADAEAGSTALGSGTRTRVCGRVRKCPSVKNFGAESIVCPGTHVSGVRQHHGPMVNQIYT
jgi:hypothetical protein